MFKPSSPNSLNLAWKMLKGNVIRLQPWFKIRRVSWLYIVAYTNGCHKDNKGDWLHRGLFHSFWWWEILVWNLVFISPGGLFGHRYVVSLATKHIVQSLPRMQKGVSFSRWSHFGLFLSSFTFNDVLAKTCFSNLRCLIFRRTFCSRMM